MNAVKRIRYPILILILLLAWSLAVSAQEYAVVRQVEGDAYVQGVGESEPQTLTLNTPLTDRDNAWTAEQGRMEILMQDGNRAWLDAYSRIEVSEWPSGNSSAGRTLKAHLWKGVAVIDVSNWPAGQVPYMVSTPSTTVALDERGLIILEVENVDRTRVTVVEGSCIVTNAGKTIRVGRMQTTYAEYGYSPLTPVSASPSQFPGIMAWRDNVRTTDLVSGESRRHVSEELYAYADDLDRNGNWSYDAEYGDVWVPATVATGWSPYYYGRWCYSNWGLTWAPFETWGWLPFHYGRWAFSVGIGWGWCPTSFFSPAWVSWYGGNGWMGWCPMGYWGHPVWGPSGWCSVGIGNIYHPRCHTVVVRHREGPPGKPIYPKPRGKGHRVTGGPGDPRVGGHATGPAISPRVVRAYTDGRITNSDVWRRAQRDPLDVNTRTSSRTEPVRMTTDPRQTVTRTGPSADVSRPRTRSDGNTAGTSSGGRDGGRGTATTNPRTTAPRTNGAQPRTTTTPRSTRTEPYSTTNPRSTRTEPQSTTTPRSTRTEPQSTTNPRSTRTEPRSTTNPRSTRTEPRATTNPRSAGNRTRQGSGSSSSYQRPTARTIPSRPSSPSGSNYQRSRGSSGSSSSRPSYSNSRSRSSGSSSSGKSSGSARSSGSSRSSGGSRSSGSTRSSGGSRSSGSSKSSGGSRSSSSSSSSGGSKKKNK